MATTFSPSVNLLPPSTNPALFASGSLTLYNPTLLLIASGLSQHALIFGFFFLLRGFSAKRVFDTHFLTFLLVLTLSLAGLVFLIDPALDNFKIFFLLEHEAVEVVVSLRILLPVEICKNRAGLILFCLWGALSTVSIIISLSEFHHHGADLVAWGAFGTDFLLGVSGIVLVKRWFDLRARLSAGTSILRVKVNAEALAGIGFILHGFSTMCIGPIFLRVIYYNADPNWFAYGFAWVFMFAIFAVPFMVPVITVFFSTIRWCCWHERKVLPGQAQWEDGDIDEAENSERKQILRVGVMDVEPSPIPLEGK